jgi:hypothetical protein
MQAEMTEAQDLARAEARLPRWMVACATLGVLTALLKEGARFAAGFALGAGLAIMAFCWLHRAVEALMSAGNSRVPKWVVGKFLMRYPLAFATVLIFYRTGWLPFMGILAGFFVPVAGAMIEGAVQLGEGLRHHG